jgi:hypothetical protein
MFARDRADLGPANAQSRAWQDLQRYGLQHGYRGVGESGGVPPGIGYHPRAPSPLPGPSR